MPSTVHSGKCSSRASRREELVMDHLVLSSAVDALRKPQLTHFTEKDNETESI